MFLLTQSSLVLVCLFIACVQSFQFNHAPHSNILPMKSNLLISNQRIFITSSNAINISMKSTTGTLTVKPSLKSIDNLNKLYIRSSWISWWIQIILTVVSGVILTFANTVRSITTIRELWFSGFSFSTVGVCISFFSSFLTWNFTRLGRRIQTQKINEENVIPTFRKYTQLSIFTSLIGMLVTLLASEQIAGNLATKVLSNQAFLPSLSYAVAPGSNLQALDIFLVQANTNTLLAHYVPMLFYSFLQTQIPEVSFNTTRSVVDDLIEKPLEKDGDESF